MVPALQMVRKALMRLKDPDIVVQWSDVGGIECVLGPRRRRMVPRV